MNSLVKEIVLDAFQEKVDIETRLDIEQAIRQYAQSTSKRSAAMLVYFAYGYTNTEIALRFKTTVTEVDKSLTAILSYIATYIGKRDDVLLHYMYTTDKLPNYRIINAASILNTYGSDFSTHTPIKELVDE